MKNEEGTYKQGNFLSNKFKPKGPRVDPVRGSAQGTKGGPGEGERQTYRITVYHMSSWVQDFKFQVDVSQRKEWIWEN